MILFPKRFIKNLVVLFLIQLCSIFTNNVFAGDVAADIPAPWELIKEAEDKGNYLGAIRLLRNQAEMYSSSLFRTQYFDLLASFESFLSMNQEAFKDDDRAINATKAADEVFDAEKYKIRNAKNIILNASNSHQAIFINEAHHSPQHRAFTLGLLQALYDNGFRYFAAETLDVMDTELNSRGYPLSRKTGPLIDEPMYGELIRAAQKIGFKVIAYESVPDCNPWLESPETCQNLREEGQARNLYEKVFKTDPSAKLLLHAGYGHIAKRELNGWVPMAVYFEQLTGINPFSIDQTIMREHSTMQYENAIFRQVADAGLLQDASVIFSNDGSVWLDGYDGIYDLIIFHPRTKYQDKRPTWLLNSENRRKWPVMTKLCKGSYPCTIEALIYEEGLNSVPVDRIVVSSPKSHPVLALFPGKYFFRSIDKTGELIFLTVNTVK